MNISPDEYEKLGQFYLGREYDLEAKKVEDGLVLYDSKDLVTHGVVLGMTGSGKTETYFEGVAAAIEDGRQLAVAEMVRRVSMAGRDVLQR